MELCVYSMDGGGLLYPSASEQLLPWLVRCCPRVPGNWHQLPQPKLLRSQNIEKKEVAMHAELLEIREEGRGGNVHSQRWCWGIVLTPREWELLLLRTWKEGPLFPTAAASMFHFISIIGVIYCHNHHLLQGLLSTMLGINKELGWNFLFFWWIMGVKHCWRCFVIISLICRQTHT